jgi:hypothetical protein
MDDLHLGSDLFTQWWSFLPSSGARIIVYSSVTCGIAASSLRTHRRATLPQMLHLEPAKTLAAERIQRMDAVLAAFTDETFGHF